MRCAIYSNDRHSIILPRSNVQDIGPAKLTPVSMFSIDMMQFCYFECHEADCVGMIVVFSSLGIVC